MRSNAGMANRQGDVDLSLPPVSTLAKKHRHSFVHSVVRRSPTGGHIKKEEATPVCPATTPRGPGTTAATGHYSSRACCPAASSTATATAPGSAVTIHRDSLARHNTHPAAPHRPRLSAGRSLCSTARSAHVSTPADNSITVASEPTKRRATKTVNRGSAVVVHHTQPHSTPQYVQGHQ